MKLITKKCTLSRHDTRKIMKLIFASFIKFNAQHSTPELLKKMENLYGKYENIKETRENLKKSKILIVAKIKKNIVGIIRGGRKYIRNLYVDERHQGLGIGKILLKKFEKKAKEYGAKTITVKPSQYARDFYKRQGFLAKDEIFFKKNM